MFTRQNRFLRFNLVVIALLSVVTVGIVAALPVAAQCNTPPGWGTYTVAPGDTLFRIARSFGTTTTELARGNCLSNTNRIYSGQVLRVPNGGENPPATSSGGVPSGGPLDPPRYYNYSQQVGATYQQFENGFMTWRQDTGAIWVFFNTGTVSGYPLNVYGGLSGGRRYYDTIPAGRNLPSGGFKTVYDNFESVRKTLGWAMGSEIGFQMYLQRPSFGQSFTASLPDGRQVQINPGGSWSTIGSQPPPTPPYPPSSPNVGATYQPFDRGFMLWRADSGDIWVYAGNETGTVSIYRAAQYGSLPDQLFILPGLDLSGRLERGFAKVWLNFPGVREQLGAPLSSETGYLMPVDTQTGAFGLPDGRIVTPVSGSTWAVRGGLYVPPAPPTPLPPTPTQTPLPGQGISGATFQPFERGFMVWLQNTGEIRAYIGSTAAGGSGTLTTYTLGQYSRLPPPSQAIFPPTDRWYPQFGFGQVWGNLPGVRDQLGWATGSEIGYQMIMTLDARGQPTSFTLPDGRIIVLRQGTTWGFGS